MNPNYPDVAVKITNDYLDRVRRAMHPVPASEREEFINELRPHIYEAYQHGEGDDPVERILAVLRNLGEPAEVVAERLPGSFVRSGVKRLLPVRIAGGVLIALFGIPLGFGGAAVLTGLLAGLVGILAGYFITAAAVFATGIGVLLLGMMRLYRPEVWDQLVRMNVIQMDPDAAEFIGIWSASDQGMLVAGAGLILILLGAAMAWAGVYLIRGLRFLASLAIDLARKGAQRIRAEFAERAAHSRSPSAKIELPDATATY